MSSGEKEGRCTQIPKKVGMDKTGVESRGGGADLVLESLGTPPVFLREISKKMEHD